MDHAHPDGVLCDICLRKKGIREGNVHKKIEHVVERVHIPQPEPRVIIEKEYIQLPAPEPRIIIEKEYIQAPAPEPRIIYEKEYIQAPAPPPEIIEKVVEKVVYKEVPVEKIVYKESQGESIVYSDEFLRHNVLNGVAKVLLTFNETDAKFHKIDNIEFCTMKLRNKCKKIKAQVLRMDDIENKLKLMENKVHAIDRLDGKHDRMVTK